VYAFFILVILWGSHLQAIEFVRSQRDDELWDHLISWALSSPDTTGALLDHIGERIAQMAFVTPTLKGYCMAA
jgi:hypothetical protein